ncbi:MAG: hypothetical protein AB1630_05495 [bacterium]
MNVLVIICFLYLGGAVYGEKNTADTIQTASLKERDPFSLSRELLKKTVSDNYVSFTGEGLAGFNLPNIEITGIMVVGSNTMATANIESLGDVVLKPNDKIVVKSEGSQKNAFISFLIKEITPNELVIILKGGQEVHQRFR